MTGDLWLRPERLFDGSRLSEGRAVRLADGRVAELGPPPAAAAVRDLPGTLSPGFVDLQVNGGGGVLVNTDPTPEGLVRIAAAHRRFGTAAILPTVITDAPDILRRAAGAALAAAGRPGLLGLHIEGPHIAPGRRGAHDARFVRGWEDETLHIVRRLRAAGLVVMVTLAPEIVPARAIAALAATGAIVSLGHSDASAEAARAGLGAGARAVTHLFNAMSQMTGREPGLTGTAIGSDAYCGIIADGIHVADEMVALAIRARPRPRRMFAVSDAMASVGGPDRFRLYGREIRVRDGRLVNAQGRLAGAHLTMAGALQRLAGPVGLSPGRALAMTVSVPAALAGLPVLAAIEGRRAEDLILLDDEWRPAGTLAGHAG